MQVSDAGGMMFIRGSCYRTMHAKGDYTRTSKIDVPNLVD